MRALISIHDVMPHTLVRVEKLLEWIPERLQRNLVLLIVPGHCWTSSQILRLRKWQQDGFILAGHGWQHQADTIRGAYHRLHAALISRNAAEHLSLSEMAIASLLNRNAAWFREQGLQPPDLYVPPAWAMGPVSQAVLRHAPFDYYETASGIYNRMTRTRRCLPLIGFEADTLLRKYALENWNALNKFLTGENRPVRIAIHPYDDQLLLAGRMDGLLQTVTTPVHYRVLFS
jgi:hypothetical protein